MYKGDDNNPLLLYHPLDSSLYKVPILIIKEQGIFFTTSNRSFFCTAEIMDERLALGLPKRMLWALAPSLRFVG